MQDWVFRLGPDLILVPYITTHLSLVLEKKKGKYFTFTKAKMVFCYKNCSDLL